jgi:hypothetical protein
MDCCWKCSERAQMYIYSKMLQRFKGVNYNAIEILNL